MVLISVNVNIEGFSYILIIVIVIMLHVFGYSPLTSFTIPKILNASLVLSTSMMS